MVNYKKEKHKSLPSIPLKNLMKSTNICKVNANINFIKSKSIISAFITKLSLFLKKKLVIKNLIIFKIIKLKTNFRF